MKKSRFSEHQIIKILKEVEAGRTAKDVCREYGISNATYYAWKSKYGGMEASDIRRMRELEYENARLKQMYADLSLEKIISKYSFTLRFVRNCLTKGYACSNSSLVSSRIETVSFTVNSFIIIVLIYLSAYYFGLGQ